MSIIDPEEQVIKNDIDAVHRYRSGNVQDRIQAYKKLQTHLHALPVAEAENLLAKVIEKDIDAFHNSFLMDNIDAELQALDDLQDDLSAVPHDNMYRIFARVKRYEQEYIDQGMDSLVNLISRPAPLSTTELSVSAEVVDKVKELFAKAKKA
jgi:hypothetical protein